MDGVFVRVGSTNRRADAELIEELRGISRGEDGADAALRLDGPKGCMWTRQNLAFGRSAVLLSATMASGKIMPRLVEARP